MKALISCIVSAILLSTSIFAQETQSLKVPFIAGLEQMDFQELQLAMETSGSRAALDQVCWPEVSSYQPLCYVTLARSESHLAILFNVRGFDLKATVLEDNRPIWTDSCCEFFVADPNGKDYHNFEINCIGTLLKAKGSSIRGRIKASQEELSEIIRFSSLPKEQIEKENAIFEWIVAMVIPYHIMGLDPENLPDTLHANFYKCGDETAHPHYLSWSPIKTTRPDFHRPEYFGELKLK